MEQVRLSGSSDVQEEMSKHSGASSVLRSKKKSQPCKYYLEHYTYIKGNVIQMKTITINNNKCYNILVLC